MAPLKIAIPSAATQTPEQGKQYTAYSVRVDHPFPRTATTLSKRYSDFTTLDSTLRSEVSAPPATLPPKSWLGGFLGLGSSLGSPEQIEKRRVGLEAYLRAIESSPDTRWRDTKAYRDFLQLDDGKKERVGSVANGSAAKDSIRDGADWLDKHALLKSSLQDARRWLTAREQATVATAQHEAAANAKKSLLRAGTLIAALEDALRSSTTGAASGEWQGEKLGEGEIRRRRDMISTLKKERDGLDSVLNTMAVKAAYASASASTASAAVTDQQKAGLFTHANKTPSRRVLGAPQHETDRTRELDNEGVLQLQKDIIQDQDEDLVDLTKVVRRMREMGVAINEEIVEQNAMLGLLEEDVTRVDGKIRIAKKRVDKIR
ncbi:hypothetical protein P153DRAFT_369665 [Dothidotthia symphoricarpi CBS 119687]|uniref:Phox-like protein n=1 Tax=Dothidotthia symphoricarpi CBS 119687 TaxID=1392245 RepID=A0A6A6A378_9PLEO|nr:uncharacterized protein P153DRAFT_369665 [Dothidotthia symphoricarpi CBS 119687]KAF2125635.1 hypothetical protein P153DRAFT_369665 [Dothidotthia symphoricarpi CBS 119687]